MDLQEKVQEISSMAALWNSDNKDQSHRNVKALLQQHSPPTTTYVTRLGCSLIANVGTPTPSRLVCPLPLAVIAIQYAVLQTGGHLQCCFTTFSNKFKSCNCLLI